MTKIILCLLLLSILYAATHQEPVQCSEDVHCDQGYFCGHKNKCYQCLTCDIFNRKPAGIPAECVYAVYHCGSCLSGYKLINDECVPSQGNFWSWPNMVIAITVVVVTCITSVGIYASWPCFSRRCSRRGNQNQATVQSHVVKYTARVIESPLATSPEPTTTSEYTTSSEPTTGSQPATSPPTMTSSEGKSEEGEVLTGTIGIKYKPDESAGEGCSSRSKSLPPSGVSDDDMAE